MTLESNWIWNRPLHLTLHRLSHKCFSFPRSLWAGAATTLEHSFITAHLDDCSSLYSGLPSTRNILCRSVCPISQILQFGHVSNYILEVLCWFPIHQHLDYMLAFHKWRWKQCLSPIYLLDLCLLVSEEIYTSTYYGRRLLFRISYNHECDENASTDCKTDLCRFFIFSDSVNNDSKDHSAKQTNTKEQTSTQTNETLKQK